MNVYQIVSPNRNLIFSYKIFQKIINVTCIILHIFFCIEFDTGSSSKEQTFDVTMNPKSGRPEVGKFTRLQNSWHFA